MTYFSKQLRMMLFLKTKVKLDKGDPEGIRKPLKEYCTLLALSDYHINFIDFLTFVFKWSNDKRKF